MIISIETGTYWSVLFEALEIGNHLVVNGDTKGEVVYKDSYEIRIKSHDDEWIRYWFVDEPHVTVIER